ncbi:hypothetical protein amrb99_59260 [Actinomadura sp. RB99]|uniref:hypothetical protein n=1 Tax=Actinomadura sp. RB99 TaxID=2691577 RepID=UPI0016826F7B|nr:hypothetical protein [Actinomadura sp. RB99]MBD2896973.1 hypothetical protein [Actinomadura sp. RB99]
MSETTIPPTSGEVATIVERLARIERVIEQLARTDSALIDIGEKQLDLFGEIAAAVRPVRPPAPRRRHLRAMKPDGEASS